MISIIIPVRYRADLTKVCIDSIIKYATDYELILIQEGEDEEITKLLKSYNTKFVHNKEPKGFAGAMNSGIRLAEGDYICFLNNDTVIIPNSLDEMLKVFKDSQVGLVAPTLPESGLKQSVDRNQGLDIEYIDDPINLKGVCFIVKRKVLDRIKGWDESFGLGGGDDNDFCIRVKEAGYKMVIARKSFIYHYGSASFRELFKNDIKYSKKYSSRQFMKLRDKHNMQNDKPTIFVSIPCEKGFVHSELALLLLNWSHNPNWNLKIRFYLCLSPLDNARNTAVKEFLEGYDDYFLHIDNDIIPPQNALEEMLKANKDVIAPLCFTMKQDDDGFWFPMIVAHRYNENKEYEPYYGKGIEETDIVTGGCHLVKRKIFDKIERPYYFTYHKNGLVEYSEDFVFSQQVQKIGYKLYTHYGLLCKHIRYVDVKSINDLMSKYAK